MTEMTEDDFEQLYLKMMRLEHQAVTLTTPDEVIRFPACHIAALLGAALQLRALLDSLTPRQHKLRWGPQDRLRESAH